MDFNGLVVVSCMLLLWLVLCDISEVQALDERKTEERREKYRQIAYAKQRRLRVIKGNRRKLWESYTKERNI